MPKTEIAPSRGVFSSLNVKQKRFVLEYLVDFEAGPAAMRAGYSKKEANTAGGRLLRLPKVSKAISKLQEQDVEDLEIDRHDTLIQLHHCLTRTLDDFCDDEGNLITNTKMLSERAKASVDGIEQFVTTSVDGSVTVKTKLRLVPKAKVIEMAMRHKGLFEPEQINVNVKQQISWDSLYQPSNKPDAIEEKIKSVGPKLIEVQAEEPTKSEL